MGMQLARVGMGLLQPPPPYLKVHFHQLIFFHKVVEPSCLQPGLCCFHSLLKVNEDPQTLFGAVQGLSQSPVMVTGKKPLQRNHQPPPAINQLQSYHNTSPLAIPSSPPTGAKG